MTQQKRNGEAGRRAGDRRATRTDSVIRVLSNWHLWVVLWGFGIVAVIGFSLVTYQQEQNDRASRRAVVQAQFEQCLAGVPVYARIGRFIMGVRDVGDVLLLNSIQVHEATPPGTPAYVAQAANIRRLRQALASQQNVAIPAPTTKAQCEAENRRNQALLRKR